jgi:hypothetical protein
MKTSIGRSKEAPADVVASVSVASPPVIRNARGRFVAGSTPPKRRARGGMVGNLNAVKNPWASFWRRRALRPQDRWILPLLDAYAGSLVADRGGPEAMTAGEAHMIEIARLARGCTLLILAEMAKGPGVGGVRRGTSTKTGDVVQSATEADLAGAMVRFMSIEANALKTIGMDRRAKPVPSLAQFLEERAAAREREGSPRDE